MNTMTVRTGVAQGRPGRRKSRRSPRARSRPDRACERGAQRLQWSSSTGCGLLPSSWDRWAALFEEAGYVALKPDWPDDPSNGRGSPGEPRRPRQEDAQAGRRSHCPGHRLPWTGSRRSSATPPVACLAEMIAGRGLSAVTVAIDPGVFRGVLPLPFSVLKGRRTVPDRPAHGRGRAITLTFDQFEYGWANALDEAGG